MNCDKSTKQINQLFDEIAKYYDKMNSAISLGTHIIVKILALKSLNISESTHLLDLCCGTGDFTKILSFIHPDTKVIGADISQEMLHKAKNKNPHGVFIKADCTNLPFKNNEFDYITIGFGLRNIENRQAVIKESFRTLKQNGKILILDFFGNNFTKFCFKTIVHIAVRIFCKDPKPYEYLIQSIEEFPKPEIIIKEFNTVGFSFIKQNKYLLGMVQSLIFIKN